MTTSPPETAHPEAAPADPAAAFKPSAETAMLRAMAKLDGVLKDHAERQAQMVLQVVIGQLPGLIARALAETSRLQCGRCALRRAAFDLAHSDELHFAWLQACNAAALAEDDPAALRLDLTPFLPEALRPDPENPIDETRMSSTYPEVARLAGWGLCVFHIQAEAAAQAKAAEPIPAETAVPAAQPAVPPRPVLFAPAGMDVHTAAREASRPMPGLPGFPGQ